MHLPLAACVLLAGVPSALAEDAPFTVVISAPGYPGTAKEAEPLMAAFARALESAAGLPKEQVRAIYEPTEKGGLARLDAPDAAVVLVPYPFFLEHGVEKSLVPELEVEMAPGGKTEVWSLVAKKGRVTSPAALATFTIQSIAGYAPGFVRGVVPEFGSLPESAKVVESSQVLSGLKKAAAGADVALVLDGTQGASLSTLAFAQELEVVAKSKPQPVGYVATVGGRLSPKRWALVKKGLLALDQSPEGKAALASLRMARFLPMAAKPEPKGAVKATKTDGAKAGEAGSAR